MMDTYEGLFGFETERRKYERQKKFKQRCCKEERAHIESLVESQIEIPKGYNHMIWQLDGITKTPLCSYKINHRSVEKRGFRSVFKKVKVRFELE